MRSTEPLPGLRVCVRSFAEHPTVSNECSNTLSNTSDCKRALGRTLQNLNTANRSTGFCHWSCFAERLAFRLALFRYRVGGPPCRWLCALPKGLYRPKRRQMGRQMNLNTFLHTLAPNCLCKYILFRQGGRVEPRSCIWPYIVGGCTSLVHYLV